MADMPDDGTMLRRSHKIFGYTLLYGGVPATCSLLARWKRWHTDVGRMLLVAFSIQVFLGP